MHSIPISTPEPHREIQDNTGAKLDIERGDKVYLVISGKAAEVIAANDAVSRVLADHSYFVTVDLLPNDVGLIVGEKGETIRKIQLESGAFLDIDRDGNHVQLRIGGQQSSVEAARAAVEKVLTSPPPLPKLGKVWKWKTGIPRARCCETSSGASALWFWLTLCGCCTIIGISW